MFGKKKLNEKVVLGNLVEGLPIPQNTDLIVKMTPDVLTIIGNCQEFEIAFSKLKLVDYKNEVEMEKIIKQSAQGMIIGAATFGLIGAMIGGRVKTKKKSCKTFFNYQLSN
ncbi:MAG: hypothetical protein ACRCZK_02475 [Oscillospiraceae bacterium]